MEAIEDRVGFTPSHVQEYALALSIEAYDFPIDDGILDLEFCQGRGQRPETLELILLSRYQAAGSALYIGLAQLDAKPTKERDSIPVTVQLPPEVYEGLQRLHGRTKAGTRARLRRQKRR